MVDTVFIIRMFEYSARKNMANIPPVYSTLNPETSSDSPSVKSKGVRFVSAIVDTNHISIIGHDVVAVHAYSWVVENSCSVYPPVCTARHIKIKPNVISYEMVCATARRAPIREYFEFEDHPDHRTVYTVALDTAIRNKSPKFMLISGSGIGRGVQINSARVKASVGAAINMVGDDWAGASGSLIKSFSPSAIG